MQILPPRERTLILPLPRGMFTATKPFWAAKAASEQLDYLIDVSNYCTTGDALVQVEVFVSGQDQALVAATLPQVGNAGLYRLSAGTPGVPYAVLCVLILRSGVELRQDVAIKVLGADQAPALPAPPAGVPTVNRYALTVGGIPVPGAS